MKIPSLVFVLFLPFAENAENILKDPHFQSSGTWSYLRLGTAGDSIASGHQENGAFVFLNPSSTGGSGRIRLVQNIVLKSGTDYLLSFRLTSPKAGNIWIGITENGKSIFHTTITGNKGKNLYFLPFRTPGGTETRNAELAIGVGRLEGKITLSDPELRKLLPTEHLACQPDSVWEVEIDGKVSRQTAVNGRLILPHRQSGQTAILRNRICASRNGYIKLGCSANWKMELSVNGLDPVYSTMEHGNRSRRYVPEDHLVFIPLKKGENVLSVRLQAGNDGWQFVYGTTSPGKTFGEKNGYSPICGTVGYIRSGTALDRSSMTDAPIRFPLRANRNGELETDGKTLRLLSFNGKPPAFETERPYGQTAGVFAKGVRAAGYNMMRLNSLDGFLVMTTSRDAEKVPGRFDQLQKLAAAFKQEGIYLHLVLLGPSLFGTPLEKSANFVRRDALKMRFYLGDEQVRKHFRYAVGLLKRPNPYTGIPLINDPVIGIVEFYNEQFMGISRISRIRSNFPEDYAFMLDKWNGWLNRRYGKTFAETDLPVFRNDKYLSHDYADFVREITEESNRWCEKVLRDAGWKGLCAQNSHKSIVFRQAGWNTMAMQDDHTYFNHPSATMSINSRVGNESSLESGVSYLTALAAGRFRGRPYSIGEIAHCFWNPYQYEWGAVWSAYSALQGFSAIAAHENAVFPRETSLTSFSIVENPIAAAGEFLAAHLFRRGDVKKANREVVYAYSAEQLKAANRWNSPVSPQLLKTALISRVSTEFPATPFSERFRQKDENVIRLSATDGTEIEDHNWFSQERGDFEKGIYRSDTGELLLDSRKKTLRITTPKSEVFLGPADAPDPVPGVLEVKERSADSCTGLVSVDGKPLSESCRLVLVHSTRAVNSHMELSGDETLLRNPGTSPVLLKTGTLALNFKSTVPGFRLYALSPTGERIEELPVKRTEAGWQITIDTAKLKHGPTVFFELNADHESVRRSSNKTDRKGS